MKDKKEKPVVVSGCPICKDGKLIKVSRIHVKCNKCPFAGMI
jgi:hypothetical protein